MTEKVRKSLHFMRKIHGRCIQMKWQFSWYHTIAISRKIKQLNRVECFIYVYFRRNMPLCTLLFYILRIAIGYLLKIFCYAQNARSECRRACWPLLLLLLLFENNWQTQMWRNKELQCERIALLSPIVAVSTDTAYSVE